ncbi:MAG: carbon storage regulator [Rubinisphaera brasiliensis]|uniref:Carbon storage regulator, CsrA n=1 Tax=Rubinisphaera brasiliensis (strain ATCC 49424 / DSM 5305 / JCM 21570 / IAM 15109 / NBRC 103401 / IFAM 1448) TaxID=756272 RepID=F0SF88_RUBBR|nr:carbon storage regulator [Rubinisphaera brasiliensis]ADY58243.1 hypothetical protein Plabr_0616 [Rubinisphaera brasiliensis DSM 5305]MBR9801595.1 carbon storage regulator [bacterium]
MKVISRKVGERVVIDGHITVTVKSVDSHEIVLAIESAHGQPRYREEIISLGDSQPVSPAPLSR